MKKFMTRSLIAALSFGAIALLPACGCGCKKEEHVAPHHAPMGSEHTKDIDARDANVNTLPAAEAAPAVEAAAEVAPAASAEHEAK
ncbi:MAG TPA: hypothetical protein VFF04_03310 [Candidatus Babeliales bacterium]|nr:hypothetical protein [Candidatus Babeliales bacterium]